MKRPTKCGMVSNESRALLLIFYIMASLSMQFCQHLGSLYITSLRNSAPACNMVSGDSNFFKNELQCISTIGVDVDVGSGPQRFKNKALLFYGQ